MSTFVVARLQRMTSSSLSGVVNFTNAVSPLEAAICVGPTNGPPQMPMGGRVTAVRGRNRGPLGRPDVGRVANLSRSGCLAPGGTVELRQRMAVSASDRRLNKTKPTPLDRPVISTINQPISQLINQPIRQSVIVQRHLRCQLNAAASITEKIRTRFSFTDPRRPKTVSASSYLGLPHFSKAPLNECNARLDVYRQLAYGIYGR